MDEGLYALSLMSLSSFLCHKVLCAPLSVCFSLTLTPSSPRAHISSWKQVQVSPSSGACHG